jgi:hypothetical protein
MAFQVGTKVDPRLGALDFSGFTNAANIQAQSIAQLGSAIGGAIQVAGEKKKEKALSKQAQEMVFGMLKKEPAQADFFGLPEDFTLADVKPIVDVIGPKPTIALITQFNMASMKDTTKRPTINDLTKLREFLPGDKIIKDGRIVDTTFRDEVLPKSDPLVQQLLQTDVGQSQLYGYDDTEFIETKEDDGTPVEPAGSIETPGINAKEEPTGSRASQLLSSIQDLNKTRQDAMLSARSLPLALGNFLFSGENPTFSESMSYAKPKMETLRDIGLARNPYEVFNPLTRIKESVGEIFFSE